MLNHSRLKLILCQLPQVDSWRNKKNRMANIPLAAGYLKAMAYKEGLLNKVDVEILDFSHNDLDGDGRLVDVIASKKPSVLGMSLYPWNAVRSLFIAGEVKKNLPKTKVIVGGAEVTAETSYILSSPNVDIGVLGEGEIAFVNLLKFFLKGKPDLSKIGGIFYRKDGEIIINPPSASLETLDEIPSPYLLGFIDISKYGRMMIETARGCSYRCKYCSVYKRSLAKKPFFSLTRIKKELEFAKDKRINLIDLHDAAFNISPYFREIVEVIKEVNFDKSMVFGVELMVELVNKEVAQLLEDCNVKFCEVGLQSTNPEVLSNVGRTTNLSDFLRGVKLLKGKGIRLSINVIVGLPGDTLETFKDTISFIKKNQLVKDVVFPSILSVGPSIALRKDSVRFGLKYQPEPPYRVMETKTLPYRDLQAALNICFSLFSASYSYYLTYPSMITYVKNDYPGGGKDNMSFDSQTKDIPDYSVNKIIFDVKSQAHSVKDITSLGENLSKRIANVTTVWFKISNFKDEKRSIKDFLSAISKKNPYVIWNIILESKDIPSLHFIQEIKNSIFYKMHNLDYDSFFLSDEPLGYKRQATRVFVVMSNDSEETDEIRLKKLNEKVDGIFWSMEFKEDSYSERKITGAFKKIGNGMLVDFHSNSKRCFIFRMLKSLQVNSMTFKKGVLFRNYMLQQLWEISVEKIAASVSGKEHTIILNQGSKIYSFFFQAKDILPNTLKWFVDFKDFCKKK